MKYVEFRMYKDGEIFACCVEATEPHYRSFLTPFPHTQSSFNPLKTGWQSKVTFGIRVETRSFNTLSSSGVNNAVVER